MIKNHSFKRVLKFGLINFWRHWWLSATSVLIMAITLIIICIFIVLTFAIQASTNSLKNKMDMTVVFKPDTTEDQIKSLQYELSLRPDVISVQYINKVSALDKWNNLKIKDSIKNLVNENNNILPEELAIKVKDPATLDDIDQFINSDIYSTVVESTSYKKNRDAIQTFLNITKVVKKVGWAVSGLFLVIALAIILTTIRMAIFTRKDEIEIMRLVGASDHFITTPFLVEGILYGLLGCLLSIIFLSLGALWVSDLANKHLSVNVDLKHTFIDNLLVIIVLQVIIGVFIGVISSLYSVKKYLKA